MKKSTPALLAAILVALLALTSCGLTEKALGMSEAELAEATEARAVAAMEADGHDLATIDPEVARAYVVEAAKGVIDDALESAERDLTAFERLLGLTFPQLGTAWAVIASGIGIFTDRGRENLAKVLSTKTDLATTARALGAVTVGLHTPRTPPKLPKPATS
jgi:hypothetical protein